MTWLPPLLTLSQHGGDWTAYELAVYMAFSNDLLYPPRTRVFGREVFVNTNLDDTNRASTYSHIISEGKVENARTPDLRRCERIRWIRALLDRAHSSDVVTWENEQPGKGRSRLIALPDFSYVVVLRERRRDYLLLTAFPVEHNRRREQLRQQYLAYVERK